MADQADVSLAPTTQATPADISPAEPITQAAPVPQAPAADGHSPGQPTPLAVRQTGDGAGEGISAKKGLDLASLNGLIEATRNDPRHLAAEAVANGQPLPPRPPEPPPKAPQAAATVTEDDGDDTAPLPAAGPDGRLPQMKIRPQSGLDQTVISLAKQQGKSVTDLAVINAARLLHNLPPLAEAGTVQAPTPGEAPAAPAPAPASDPASALADLDAEIARVKAERTAAKNDFDFDAESAAEERLEQLREQRTNLVIESRTQARTTEDANAKAFADANAAAIKRFAALADDNSPLTVRARALQQQAVEANDSFAWDPRSILHFANEAAAELGIAPASAAPAPAPSPAPSARPPLSIVSGGSQQTPPNRANTDTNPRLESPADYEALMARLTGVNYGGSRRPVHA